jgi:hypothetical protein
VTVVTINISPLSVFGVLVLCTLSEPVSSSLSIICMKPDKVLGVSTVIEKMITATTTTTTTTMTAAVTINTAAGKFVDIFIFLFNFIIKLIR